MDDNISVSWETIAHFNKNWDKSLLQKLQFSNKSKENFNIYTKNCKKKRHIYEELLKLFYKNRRGFDNVKLFPNIFSDEEEIHWHHYDDTYIVAIPKDIHMIHYGKGHREKLKPIVHQIYLDY